MPPARPVAAAAKSIGVASVSPLCGLVKFGDRPNEGYGAGLKADEAVPDGWRCPLDAVGGVAAGLSVRDGNVATPLIGHVLLRTPSATDNEDEAPLLLRAVDASQAAGATDASQATGAADASPAAGTADGSQAAGAADASQAAGAADGSQAAGTADGSQAAGAADASQAAGTADGSQAAGTADGSQAAGAADAPQADGIRVHCVSLLAGDDRVYRLPLKEALAAALRRETLEVSSLNKSTANGGKVAWISKTPDCRLPRGNRKPRQ